MENLFVSHGRRDNHFSFHTVFPFADSNLVESKYELCTRILDIVLDVFNSRFKKSSRHFQSLVFLKETFRFKIFVDMPGQK
jgi:hypothetical protein